MCSQYMPHAIMKETARLGQVVQVRQFKTVEKDNRNNAEKGNAKNVTPLLISYYLYTSLKTIQKIKGEFHVFITTLRISSLGSSQ